MLIPHLHKALFVVGNPQTVFIIEMKHTLILLLLFLLYSCDNFTFKKPTPKAYLNETRPVEAVYRNDTADIRNRLLQSLSAHHDFFRNSAYDSSTELLIDTVVYSPDFHKAVAFIMTKNSTSKQLMPDKSSQFYFDGTAFLVKKKDSMLIEWLGPSFTNSNSQKALSREMRDYFFNAFADKDSTQPFFSPYHLNDKRFWTTAVWNKFK